MLKASDVKRMAKECGADLCGIASMDRFEGAPKQQDPRYIFGIGVFWHRGLSWGVKYKPFSNKFSQCHSSS